MLTVSCSDPVSQVQTYAVIYDANGASPGSVPMGGNKYEEGAEVGVLGNTGNLGNERQVFSCWNTRADGSGTPYEAEQTFIMGRNPVTLYATWVPDGLVIVSEGGTVTLTGCTTQPVGALVIPDGVTVIGEGAFQSCAELTSVTMPDSVTIIETSAFYACPGLTSLTLSPNVTTIEANAFMGCTSLPELTIPAKVAGIGQWAFAGCYVLTSVTIPASVTQIGGGIFSGCPDLMNIGVEAANPAYPSNGGVLYDDAGSTLLQVPAGTSGNFTVPASVMNIGFDAFGGCEALTGISVQDGNPNFAASGGVLFNQAQTVLVKFPGNYTVGNSYSIPSGVTDIIAYAFSKCSLVVVTIPTSVTTMGNGAFEKSGSLSSVTVNPTTPPALSPKSNAFSKCSSSLQIHVSADNLVAYKSAVGWSVYSEQIVAP